jgi:hypothetical protein
MKSFSARAPINVPYVPIIFTSRSGAPAQGDLPILYNRCKNLEIIFTLVDDCSQGTQTPGRNLDLNFNISGWDEAILLGDTVDDRVPGRHDILDSEISLCV